MAGAAEAGLAGVAEDGAEGDSREIKDRFEIFIHLLLRFYGQFGRVGI